MPSRSSPAGVRSSGSPGRSILGGNRLFRDLQYLVAGEFPRHVLGIVQGLGGLDREFGADAVFDDFVEWGGAVGGLPQNCGRLVQRKECGVAARHDHHFAVETTRCDSRVACNVKPAHPISSQTRASGTKVRRDTGTRLTKSKAERKTDCTSSSSSAKKRRLASKDRAASPGGMGSMRFSLPLASRYNAARGAETFSPSLANSPVNGVPKAT